MKTDLSTFSFQTPITLLFFLPTSLPYFAKSSTMRSHHQRTPPPTKQINVTMCNVTRTTKFNDHIIPLQQPQSSTNEHNYTTSHPSYHKASNSEHPKYPP
mmetsp:Transcript_62342/g.92601  ORF Transcript_62342/g.92601 Transcript_62342/m.92601 type:complete len:100 (-) Transcript_62342:2445-2744(-)